jgi:predicted short-subunit dehydrogenase-like oxidoreductase (DUF2520 family)
LEAGDRKPRFASAILPAMAAKPRIAIVGAGNLGSALAVSLHRAGYRIDQIVARDEAASVRRARSLAKKVAARAVTARRGEIAAEVVWLCVPDGEIAPAARLLAASKGFRARVALHSSGALTSDELNALRQRGVAVGSVHPLMTFVPRSRPSLAGVPFAIEGDAAAVRVARRMVKDLGGSAYSIRKSDKAAYHAWGTFASPLLTALLATTERVAANAGEGGKAARSRMLPILQQTLSNYVALGGRDSFSGPLVRGDVGIIKRHLHSLRPIPAALDVYLALARAALRYLPVKNRQRLRKVLG